MKTKILRHVLAALYSFVFAVSAVGCIVTGFDLSAAHSGWILIWCAVFAVIPAVLWFFRFGWIGIVLLSVRGAFAIWQDGALWDEIQSLAYTISSHYHNVYNWQTIGEPVTDGIDLALILLAYLIAMAVNFCICRSRPLFTAIVPVILPLVLCLITTDTLPDEIVLLPMMAAIVILLLTDWVRRQSPMQYPKLTFRVLIPSAAALVLLFALNPQEEYVNRAAELQKNVTGMIEQIGDTAEAVVKGSFTGFHAAQSLDLRDVGPKSDYTYSVMRVTSPFDGALYLRGRDYDVYTGTDWESTKLRHETFTTAPSGTGNVTVWTFGVKGFRYVPYYTTDEIELISGYAENDENESVYSYPVARVPMKKTGTAPDEDHYTDLPADTYKWAKELLKTIVSGNASEWSKTEAIAGYVRNSASYDLSTAAMPEENGDFARWFLTESDTGYCVHFATAAAVLLRAAKIPARYVEGYLIHCQADEKTPVTNHEAHAWVEYYDSGSGVWRILEATPAAGISPPADVTAPDEPDETDETEPEETESPETEPEETVPEETVPPETESHETEPDETTAPVQNGAKPSGGNSGGKGNSGSGTSQSSGSSGDTDDTPAEKEPFRLPDWVKKAAKVTGIVLAVLAVIHAQAVIRIAWRRRQWYRGTPNEMAVIRWRQSRRLARLTGTEMPALLDALAMKAKFSQHTLTREELFRFEQYRRRIVIAVSQMPWYRRAVYYWILAVG
ncbi:MAG: transglutaminase domain-containing protein [Clostridia bacterium]|nr:transglutaminase domain-containing protein [Clostridia bacterium]